MRTQIRRRKRNRRIMILGIVVVFGALIVAGTFLLSTAGTPLEKQIGQPVSSSVYQEMFNASANGLGTVNQTLMHRVQSFSGQPFLSGTKPIIVYIGANYCPYCAFQRWPLVMALMRFGNFSNLDYMLSSSTDVFPNTPTFTFYGSRYASNYIVFQGYEQEDRSQASLQTVPSNYTSVFQQFGSSYPFIDVANKYVMSGSFFFPDQLVGKSWTQVAQLLSSNKVVSSQIISSANAITAAICKVMRNAPGSVCGNSAISGLTTLLTAYHPPGSVSSQMLVLPGRSATQLRNMAMSLAVAPIRTIWGSDRLSAEKA